MVVVALVSYLRSKQVWSGKSDTTEVTDISRKAQVNFDVGESNARVYFQLYAADNETTAAQELIKTSSTGPKGDDDGWLLDINATRDVGTFKAYLRSPDSFFELPIVPCTNKMLDGETKVEGFYCFDISDVPKELRFGTDKKRRATWFELWW